ncbi:MAG TPA: LD-carboxypeptidase [Bacteroidales bacterium]|nr:LD-carboxypeptidase [Bacteroidales bacterium]
MIRPPYLKKGDRISIVAPAGTLVKNEIAEACDLMQEWGVEPVFGKHLFRKQQSFAGTDAQRAEDFQHMLDDPSIRAIICARGGYGTIRIIDKLDFSAFKKKPKWIVGYSDITILHCALQQRLGIESIHGPMPRFVPPKSPDLVSFDTLRALLFGEEGEYILQPNRLNRKGKGKGILTGGNLSVLYSLAGSVYDPDMDGKILFIEDIGENLYHIDRMMMSLKIRGKLDMLNGLIVGEMTDMNGSKAGFHKPAYQIIKEHTAAYDYPVIFGFPAGHGETNLAMVMGRETEMRVEEKCSSLRGA